MITQFYRRQRFIEALACGETQFDEFRKSGVIPEPDGYLGPRSPFWTAETVRTVQLRLMSQPKPVETRPRRAQTAATEAA